MLTETPLPGQFLPPRTPPRIQKLWFTEWMSHVLLGAPPHGQKGPVAPLPFSTNLGPTPLPTEEFQHPIWMHPTHL